LSVASGVEGDGEREVVAPVAEDEDIKMARAKGGKRDEDKTVSWA
jgi:hypothetical protein